MTKVKLVKMSNLDFIRKWQTNEDNLWTNIYVEGEMVTEIDEENEIIYTENGDINFVDIERYSVWANECEDIDWNDELKIFMNNIKKSIRFASKLYYGEGIVFSRQCDDGFLNEEYMREEWKELGTIVNDYNNGLKMTWMKTIEKCDNGL